MNHSPFVQSVAQEFRQRYPLPSVGKDSDETSLWFEWTAPSRARSPLSFGISDSSLTVAFDGLTIPIIIDAPTIDAEKARRKAFALFDDLVSERKVSISFWQGDECCGVEFVEQEQIQSQRSAWVGYGFRVRSWTGKYDHDYPA
jgi:hypothetical protein